MNTLKEESLKLARDFHRYYESLAPSYGYETKEDTRTFDEESSNGQLMVAVCEEIIKSHINPLTERIIELNERRFDLMTKYNRLSDEVELAFRKADCEFSLSFAVEPEGQGSPEVCDE